MRQASSCGASAATTSFTRRPPRPAHTVAAPEPRAGWGWWRRRAIRRRRTRGSTRRCASGRRRAPRRRRGCGGRRFAPAGRGRVPMIGSSHAAGASAAETSGSSSSGPGIGTGGWRGQVERAGEGVGDRGARAARGRARRRRRRRQLRRRREVGGEARRVDPLEPRRVPAVERREPGLLEVGGDVAASAPRPARARRTSRRPTARRSSSRRTPRVAGESNIGGRTAVRVRSPRSRLRRDPASAAVRSGTAVAAEAGRMAKLATSVAFGHRSSTASRLPMWSWSSWDRTIQRTSSGSTSEVTWSIHASRTRSEPVSTITGSAPRITRLCAPKKAPDGSAANVGTSQVSAVTGCGRVGRISGVSWCQPFVGVRLYWLELVVLNQTLS